MTRTVRMFDWIERNSSPDAVLTELLREHPDQFRLVYRSADSRYRIYVPS